MSIQDVTSSNICLFSRKGGIYITNALALVGAVFFVSCYPANSVEMLLIGRLLVGLAGGILKSNP